MGNSESKKYGSADSIFVLCETCHWCATYFDKSRVPNDKCPNCGNTATQLSLYYQMKSIPLIIMKSVE